MCPGSAATGNTFGGTGKAESSAQSVMQAEWFQAGTPQPLFQTDMVDTGIRTGPMSWDLAPDGNRFLIISENPSDTSSLTVALNWRAALMK